VVGLPEDSSFAATFLRNGLTLDREAVEREVVAAGVELVAKHPAVDTVVLECTNLPPYRRALEKALGLPVLDVLDLLKDFRAELTGTASGGRAAAAAPG
jgi:Asp/Glu/hydantoin racemase